jgi:hypothetical protein
MTALERPLPLVELEGGRQSSAAIEEAARVSGGDEYVWRNSL